MTLIELAVVTAVIGIIAAVVTPSLRDARSTANEGAVVNTLRTIHGGNELFRLRYGNYASGLDNLATSGYVDEVVGDSSLYPGKSGYVLSYVNLGGDDWAIEASPLNPGTSGNRYFYIDVTGVIRQNPTATASDSDPPIE